jgi:dienelactone hydrolase
VAPVVLIVLALTATLRASEAVTWKSPTIDGDVRGELFVPADAKPKLPAVIILKNLAALRVGTEFCDAIVADFVKDGCIVLVLDYAKHASATSPALNADILKLREDVAGKNKSLLTDVPVDADRLYILPEGYRLMRDVEFARDGRRVLAMDVAYPSQPKAPAPMLMEITCDNVNRMGAGSLLFCRDTLLEGAAVAGFAVAMVDHPVPPPYKGLDDPMPQSLHRTKAAVRTLRSLARQVNGNGKIGVVGFSRGGPFAAMLAVSNGRADLEGEVDVHRDVSSDVQAAMIHGNRYDYLNLRADDPMLARFEKAWGKRETNEQRWAEHGASYYVGKRIAPMFLNTSDAESPEYRDGLAKFDARLTQLGAEHVYQVDADARGHRVTTDPKTLSNVYEFFTKQLR